MGPTWMPIGRRAIRLGGRMADATQRAGACVPATAAKAVVGVHRMLTEDRMTTERVHSGGVASLSVSLSTSHAPISPCQVLTVRVPVPLRPSLPTCGWLRSGAPCSCVGSPAEGRRLVLAVTVGHTGLSRRGVREESVLILTSSRMHDDAALLCLIAVPEIHHEDQTVAVDGTGGGCQIVTLHASRASEMHSLW